MTPFTRLFLNLKTEHPNACFLFLYDEHFYAFGEDAHVISRLTKQDIHYNEHLPETIQASTCFPISDLSYYFQLFSIEIYRLIIKNPALGANPKDQELYQALEGCIQSMTHCRFQVKTA